MKKRPCMFMCLTFLIIRTIVLCVTGGQSFVKMPADSILQKMKEEQNVLVQGQVYKKSNTSKVQILYLKNNSIYSQNNSFYESRILIYDETFQEIEIGKTVKLQGDITAFQEACNPGNFDQKFYYAKQNIYGSIWSRQILEIEGEEDYFREKLYQIKEQWKRNLFEGLGEKNGAVLSAMLLSEKGEMDAEIKELYQKNGIGHILAISGLHISFIGLGIYQLVRKMECPYWLAGIVSVLLLSAYAFMIGFSVSVLRAYVMLILRIGADMVGRVYDMATSLSLAGVITVIWQPLYLFDAGFLMSYGAILGVLLVLPVVETMFPGKYKSLSGFYAGFAIQLILFPVLLFFYFEFPVYSFLLNMAVIPMMSVVLGLGILGSGVFLLWKTAGVWLLKCCGFLVEIFEFLSRFGSVLPGARVVFGKPYWWQIVVYYVILAVFLLWFYRWHRLEQKQRWSKGKIRCCFGIMCVAIVLQFLAGHGKFLGFFGNGKIAVTVVDVGQGDGIFLKGPNGGTYLIDGGSSDVNEVGKYRLEPFLKSQGVGKLDYVFLSHGDSDHCNGVEELILRKNIGVMIEYLVFPATYKTDQALRRLAVLAEENGVKTVVMEGGQSLTEGKMTVTCIQPCHEEGNLEGNAGSMVLDVTFCEFDMLCTGDVEAEGEESLIQKLGRKEYDVLKVAHHGSKNSTSEMFLEKVKPKIAVISAGEKNRYGHPHKETVDRLEESGCEIYSTVECGAVRMWSDGKTLRVDGFH